MRRIGRRAERYWIAFASAETENGKGKIERRKADTSFGYWELESEERLKRPWEVTILGLLFIFAGAVGLFYHLTQDKLDWATVPILLLRVLAVIGGIFLLLGRNWARWLTAGWLALHVAISAFHSMEQLVAHVVLLAIVAYFLFKDHAADYFRPATQS